MDPLIRTENLEVVFNKGKSNEFVALKNVNIKIYPKEYVVFFGPSGSGKSTLLYTLLGLLTPTGGKIFIFDEDYLSFTEREKNARTSSMFGIVFQQFNLLSSLSTIDNVTLPQVFLNKPEKERREKALVLLRRFGIEARANRSPAELSGGQQQRVAVCRALINDPAIVLADEPVGNLDSASAKIVMETLKEINVKDMKTVILVTHDQRYLSYADRVYFFNDTGIEREERMSGKGPDDEVAGSAAELEKLARVHTSLTASELKAWGLTNWLSDELTLDQQQRLEAAMEKLIRGELSPHGFFEYLDRAYADNGVGLYSRTAVAFTKKITRILHEMRMYAERSQHLDSNHKRKHLMQLLRSYLLEEFRGDLSHERSATLGEAVSERMLGKTNRAEFLAQLVKPIKDGGVGLHPVVSQRLADRLEIIMSRANADV